MKQGWKIKKLGEVCKKITNIKWNEIEETTSFPYIDLSAVDRENSSIHDYEYINISNAPSRAKQIVKVGDILFATTRPMLKRACIIPNEFNNAIASTGFCVLRPQGAVLSEWIYHNIKSNRFYKYIEPIQKGVSYPAVTDNEVKDFCIPVPSIEEQERIVEELDCLSGVIERKREQLRELDALAQSIFYQMFGDPITNEKGWEVKKLGEIATSQIGITYKPENVSDNDEGTIVLRSSNIQNSTLCFEDIVRVKCDIKENKYVKDGDILMCSRNGSFRLVGKVAMIANLPEPMTYGAFMTIIRSPYQAYLFAFFKSPAFRTQLTTSKTATINQITVKMLDEIKVALPPLTLQQQFADKIEAIEKQKELIKQSITQTEELFNSRMDYYFN